ncbi:class E sortase [Demequina sp. NBRC 110051]|uniref:class E sortase n=1 Tax=Demequina sp. NBRC 110051 TaxID=1570340 RepID=UPI0009FB9FF0|nr:class E sortase [Demequina sp. NBRC 110051]
MSAFPGVEASPSAPDGGNHADHGPVHARPRPRITVLGVIGELLVLAGVLLGLYVVWELFYTDVQGDRAQREIVEELAWAEPEVIEGDVATSSVDTIPDDLKVTDEDPPEMAYPEFTETFATMMVPRWGDDYVRPISEGSTRADVLDPLGIGHYEGSALPGELGNFAISGHRTTYGKPFNRVDELHEGDALIVQTEGIWAVYEVTGWEIVDPTAIEVIAPTPNRPGAGATGRFMTLTTCHPLYSAAERWIVYSELKYWAPTGHGVPSELTEVPA